MFDVEYLTRLAFNQWEHITVVSASPSALTVESPDEPDTGTGSSIRARRNALGLSVARSFRWRT
jgi:hypothetical protein